MTIDASVIAPVWRRIAALVYDTLILLAISLLYGATVTTIAVQYGESPESFQPMFKSALFIIGWFLCLSGFYCWFWHKSGQTLGMKTWRLKLINEAPNMHKTTWGQCLIRALVSPLIILMFGLGYWYSFFDKEKNCLHDKLSKTRVIVIKKGL